MKRVTKETKVEVSIGLDGRGVCQANSQIPFLDHMLDVRLEAHLLLTGWLCCVLKPLPSNLSVSTWYVFHAPWSLVCFRAQDSHRVHVPL